MKYAAVILSAFLALITSGQSSAQGTMIHTMPKGYYVCALPGDASSEAWRAVKGADFTIGNASSYETQKGRGTYLLANKELVFTRGPLKGQRFRRVSDNLLRQIDPQGELGRMRCARSAR